MDLEGDFSEMDETARALERAGEQIQARIPPTMRRATLVVEGEAKVRAPVNLGRLRSSITSEVRGAAMETVGVVGSNVQYAPYVELGTRPHWPPRQNIMFWVMRKLGVSGPGLYAVTLGVQRAIAAKGTKAVRFLQGALEEKRDDVIALFVDLVRQIDV